MRVWLPFSLAAFPLLTMTGCVYGHHAHAPSDGEVIGFGVGMLVEAVVASRQMPRPEPRTVYVVTGPMPVSPPSLRDRIPIDDGPPTFDPVLARKTLAAVDVTDCTPRDAGPRYGHATVAFSPEGFVTKVLIDQPRVLDAAAVQCVGEHLGRVTVHPFRGSRVVVGTVFRI